MATIEITIRAENGENVKDAVLRAFGINTPEPVVSELGPALNQMQPVVVGSQEDAIVNFLRSDPRYTMRSESAIVEKMRSSVFDVKGVLEDMVDDGTLGTKTRRSDGATLYYVR